MRKHKLQVSPAWEQAIDDFIIHLLAHGRSLTTVDLREGWLRRFARAVACGPWDVTARDIVIWSASQDWAQDTRRSAHQSVSGFYAWAEAQGLITSAPLVPTVRASAPSPRPAGDSAVDAALHTEDVRVGLAVHLGAELGLRRAEIAQLHSQDIIEDLYGYSVIVHGKGNKQRIVPLPSMLAERLRSYFNGRQGYLFPGSDGGHISPSWLGTIVNRTLPPGTTMHMLRHRFSTRAYARTHDLVALQKVLGHASPQTTLRYLALADESLRAVVEAAA